MKSLTYLLLVFVAGVLAGCEVLVEAASGDRVENGGHCINIQMQCKPENYSEWQDKAGMTRCSCRDYLRSGVPNL